MSGGWEAAPSHGGDGSGSWCDVSKAECGSLSAPGIFKVRPLSPSCPVCRSHATEGTRDVDKDLSTRKFNVASRQ